MPTTTTDDLAAKAAELAGGADRQSAVGTLVAECGGDRAALEAARDLTARKVRARIDDWEATAALTLLNLALANLPRHDPLDWRERWARHRKP